MGRTDGGASLRQTEMHKVNAIFAPLLPLEASRKVADLKEAKSPGCRNVGDYRGKTLERREPPSSGVKMQPVNSPEAGGQPRS